MATFPTPQPSDRRIWMVSYCDNAEHLDPFGIIFLESTTEHIQTAAIVHRPPGECWIRVEPAPTVLLSPDAFFS